MRIKPDQISAAPIFRAICPTHMPSLHSLRARPSITTTDSLGYSSPSLSFLLPTTTSLSERLSRDEDVRRTIACCRDRPGRLQRGQRSDHERDLLEHIFMGQSWSAKSWPHPSYTPLPTLRLDVQLEVAEPVSGGSVHGRSMQRRT